ncbi:MAG: hypothetical protein AAGH99_16315, partial [Planctomycetota bacterium]
GFDTTATAARPQQAPREVKMYGSGPTQPASTPEPATAEKPAEKKPPAPGQRPRKRHRRAL